MLGQFLSTPMPVFARTFPSTSRAHARVTVIKPESPKTIFVRSRSLASHLANTLEIFDRLAQLLADFLSLLSKTRRCTQLID